MKKLFFLTIALLGFNLISAQYEDLTEEKVAAMSDEQLKQLVKETVAITNLNAKAFGIAIREYGVRTGSAIKVGGIVYFKTAGDVKIPTNATLTKESEYASGKSNWKTYDFEDDSKFYSITLNTSKRQVVSRYVTEKN